MNTTGWESKNRSPKTVSNPYNDEIYNAVIEAGALAGKVSGAGGGEFNMFFVPTERRMDTVRTLNRFDGQVSRPLVQAWYAGLSGLKEKKSYLFFRYCIMLVMLEFWTLDCLSGDEND